MADEFVRKEHFDEHVLRMDERFLSLEKRLEQGFAHAEKAREQNFVHMNQRFDDLLQGIDQRFEGINRRFDGINQRFDSLERRMEEGFSELQADMRQMRNWLVWPFGLVVFGFIGSIVLILFRDLILK
jgi:hypothetical protein